MTDAAQLTPYNAGRIDAVNWPAALAHLTPLLDAGVPQDTAVDVLLARRARGAASVAYFADAAVFAVHPDLDLLVTLVNVNVNTRNLLDAAGVCVATRESIDACLTHDVSYVHLQAWVRSGRGISELTGALTDLDAAPGYPSEHAIDALLGGASVDDLRWLASRTVYLGQELNLHEHLRHPDKDAARRLALLLVACDIPCEMANSIAIAAHDAPWLDTLAALIADGGNLADSLVSAQAEHALHVRQQRAGARTARSARAVTRAGSVERGRTP
jgi:hypothetical protein